MPSSGSPPFPAPAPAPALPCPERLPRLLLTCGDPAGIGPEIVRKAWRDASLHAVARMRVVASAGVLGEGSVVEVEPGDPRPSSPDTILRIDPAGDTGRSPPRTPERFVPGRPSAAGGRAAAEAVERAVDLTLREFADAIVTGPLNKAALRAAGYDVPGHTELLARGCGLPEAAVSMMLYLPPGPGLASPGGLGVVHVTLHESLRTAVARISTEGIVAAGERLSRLMHRFLERPARIAVCAVNPHGGESGLFGDEETRIVEPAVRSLAASGIDVAGPLPADTLFLECRRGRFDGVVALYHDQGHIPVKLLGMHRAVNITLGLPIVRTSVAHGTAYDIAGTGAADASSMVSAIRAAVRLCATVRGGADSRSREGSP